MKNTFYLTAGFVGLAVLWWGNKPGLMLGIVIAIAFVGIGQLVDRISR